METGKPDKVGEAGEETLGPLSLPRPKAYLWPMWIALGCVSAISGWVQSSLENDHNWTKDEANWGATWLKIGCFSLVLLASWFNTYRLKSHEYRLSISRGISSSDLGDVNFEIWAGPDFLLRETDHPFVVSVAVLYGSLGVVGSSLLILWGTSSSWKFCGWLALLVFGLLFAISIPSISRPLLTVDSHTVTLLKGKIDWDRIHTVEVEHLLNLFGDFNKVRLTFLDKDKLELGRVCLPGERLNPAEEHHLLEFFAKVLGRRVSPVALNTPDWI